MMIHDIKKVIPSLTVAGYYDRFAAHANSGKLKTTGSITDSYGAPRIAWISQNLA
jgi:hypothetical protein